MKKILILFIILLPTIVAAQAPTKIETKIIDKVDYYEWLTSLSVGPFEWVEMSQDDYENAGPNVVVGRRYRVAVATSEIYSSVYIEEITEGSEGCCVTNQFNSETRSI